MSWIDAPVVVHVGLPKTATSWLQQYYFPYAKHGFWVPPVPSQAKHPIKQIGHSIISDEQGRLIPEEDFDDVKLRNLLSGLEKPMRLMPVISNERLAGHPQSNGFDREMLARRIKRVFPKARILVTIREQNRIIMSSYMQYLKYGGWHTPERYLLPDSDTRQPVLTLHYWNYDRLAALYQNIFGAENVLLLPQEMLRSDPLGFLKKIAAFSGVAPPASAESSVETNPRKPHASSYLLRRLTALGRKSSANAYKPSILGTGPGKIVDRTAKSIASVLTPGYMEKRVEDSLARRIDKIVGDTYRQSNRQLASRAGFDPALFGYRT